MNLAELLRYRGLLASAFGAGVMLIGAAGMFLYHRLYAERRRMLLQREVARLGMTVAEMKSELDSLRRKNCCKHSARRKKNSTFTEVDSDFDMHSALDVNSTIDDDDLEEFFDLSDDDDVLRSEHFSQDVEACPELVQIFSNVDNLMKGDTEEQISAYGVLLEYTAQFPENAGLLWRLAKVCHLMGTAEISDAERRKEHVFRGCAYAQRALELDDSSAETHKWYAITIGSRGEFVGIQDKICDGLVFKDHVDEALKINPNDATLYHLLGRFKYEIATLSWIKRVAARKICPNFPTATFQEALDDFLKADKFSLIPWKENKLQIAKCYIGNEDVANAVQWLNLAVKLPVTLPEDQAVQQEIQELLTKYET